MQINDYVDLADVQPDFIYADDEVKLRSKSWPCRIIDASSMHFKFQGDRYIYWRKDRFIPHKPVYWCDRSGTQRWRFINNKMEWSENGGPWLPNNNTPEQVDSWTSVRRYNPLLYSDIIIKAPSYVDVYNPLEGSQIRQDNYVVTIQMPSADAAKVLINFLESLKNDNQG